MVRSDRAVPATETLELLVKKTRPENLLLSFSSNAISHSPFPRSISIATVVVYKDPAERHGASCASFVQGPQKLTSHPRIRVTFYSYYVNRR